MDATDVLPHLEELRALIKEDGADFEVVSVSPQEGAVELRLILDRVECVECVTPRPILESIYLDMLRKSVPEVVRVSLIDPREHEPA